MYLETPDAQAFVKHLFKSNWGMTHFPRHFNLFSKKGLARLAKDSGLKVLSQNNVTSAPGWNMSFRNSLKMDALNKKDSFLEIFNYSNLFTLTFFSIVDLAFISLGIHTSSQQLVAKK